jgi:hypothetical protein
MRVDLVKDGYWKNKENNLRVYTESIDSLKFIEIRQYAQRIEKRDSFKGRIYIVFVLQKQLKKQTIEYGLPAAYHIDNIYMDGRLHWYFIDNVKSMIEVNERLSLINLEVEA